MISLLWVLKGQSKDKISTSLRDLWTNTDWPPIPTDPRTCVRGYPGPVGLAEESTRRSAGGAHYARGLRTRPSSGSHRAGAGHAEPDGARGARAVPGEVQPISQSLERVPGPMFGRCFFVFLAMFCDFASLVHLYIYIYRETSTLFALMHDTCTFVLA